MPSLATLSSGEVWVASQSWDGVGDHVELSPVTDVSTVIVPVTASQTRVLGTALAADVDDVLHVVWSEQEPVEGGGWSLRESRVPAGAEPGTLGAPSLPAVVAGGPGRHLLMPVLAADGTGQLLLVWMEIAGPSMGIGARLWRKGSGWGDEVVVSSGTWSHWAPDATVIGPGRFAVVWDGAVDGDYDVSLARLEVGADGELSVTSRQRVTDSPRYEAHASVAAAGERLYIAYETAQAGWGREGSVNDLSQALHNLRELEIVAVEGDRVAPLAEPFMDGISPALQGGCERPRLFVDGGGNLNLFFRGMPLPDEAEDPNDPVFQRYIEQRDGAGVGWRTAIWFSYVARYDGLSWDFNGRHQQGLPGSNGRSDAPIALSRLKEGGIAYAVVGDGRERVVPPKGKGRTPPPPSVTNWWCPITARPTDVTAARIRKGRAVDALPLGESRPLPASREPSANDAASLPTRSLPDGTTLTLALGDLHRHTDLSRCSGNWDGPFTDAMRYAFDVGGLQFVAVTDHFEHMQRYDWWRSLSQMDAFHAPGRLVNLRAYERADAYTGHRNIISADGQIPVVSYRKSYDPDRDDARADTPAAMWKHFASRDVLSIPHTPAGMYHASQAVMDWLSFEPEFDRVVEIWQGYRGSSEAADAPRAIDSQFPRRFVRPALDGGMHFGFIGSSDHQSSYGAFAGAWVTALDRRAVFDALHARRTFASTAPMALWSSWNGVPMGSSARAAVGATSGFQLDVDPMGRALALIELIVDGKVAAARDVSSGPLDRARAQSFGFDGPFLDVPAAGTRYVYARVRTDDGELGWTSPVRLGADDWLGPDGPDGVAAYDEKLGKKLQMQHPFAESWQGPGGVRREPPKAGPEAWAERQDVDPETGAPLSGDKP